VLDDGNITTFTQQQLDLGTVRHQTLNHWGSHGNDNEWFRLLGCDIM
jgi:hypothetical protein